MTALTLIAAGLPRMWRRPRAVGGADWLAVPQIRRLGLFEPVRNHRALSRLGQRSWLYKPSLSRRQNPREGRAEA
jgi:hypothetical protein